MVEEVVESSQSKEVMKDGAATATFENVISGTNRSQFMSEPVVQESTASIPCDQVKQRTSVNSRRQPRKRKFSSGGMVIVVVYIRVEVQGNNSASIPKGSGRGDESHSRVAVVKEQGP